MVLAAGVVPVFVSKLPLPSRSHSYLAIVPSRSVEPEPSKPISWPAWAGFGEALKEATGAWLLPPKCWAIVEAGSARL